MAMSELLKKTVLVGIGAAAEVADRSKDLTDSLAKKGQDTINKGRAMNEELKRSEFCKSSAFTYCVIAFVVCLVWFVFFLFWSPSRELAKKDVKIVLKEDCNKWIYVWSGESGKLEETNETLKAGTSLKGIAEDGRWTWIVEDERQPLWRAQIGCRR